MKNEVRHQSFSLSGPTERYSMAHITVFPVKVVNFSCPADFVHLLIFITSLTTKELGLPYFSTRIFFMEINRAAFPLDVSK
jgi:hypothetical protein